MGYLEPPPFLHMGRCRDEAKTLQRVGLSLPKIRNGTFKKDCSSLLVEFLQQFQDLMFSQGKGVTSKVDHILGGLKGDPR